MVCAESTVKKAWHYGRALHAGMSRQCADSAVASRPCAEHDLTMGFVHDELSNGRRFRALTIVDLYTRECLAVDVGQHLRGERVVTALERLRQDRGVPKYLRTDHGSEFVTRIVDLWAFQHQVSMDFTRPGKPTDNGHVESFNGRLREECLNTHRFGSIDEAQREIDAWRKDYNDSRPHRTLGGLTPSELAAKAANEDRKLA